MLKVLNKQFEKRYFPLSLKYLTLAIYISLVVIGFTASATDAEFLVQLRNTNLGNLIVWSYWWPAIVILAILFGRIWCMVCPVEIITTLFAKIGLKRDRPSWLRSGWIITVFYILVLFVGTQGLAIHRNPTYMAVYLLFIAGVSVIIGSIYKKNTFCRYVCPVGYILGLYSRLSFLGWRVKDKQTCDTCRDKSCIHKQYQYNLNYKSCGVDLYPATIDDNTDCILCAGCLKTCGTYKSAPSVNRPNPGLTRVGFAHDLLKLKPLKMAELVFVLMVSGFVIYELWVEWSVTDSMIKYFPNRVINSLSVSSNLAAGILKSTILFGIVPFVLWLLPFLLSKLAGMSLKFKDYLLNYGIAFIPIIAAAHLNKALVKVISRVPYFEHLSGDITGMSTAQEIVEGGIVLQSIPNWLNFIVSLLITGIIAVGILLSIKIVRRMNRKKEMPVSGGLLYFIPGIYGGIFLVMILLWRWVT